MVITPGRSTHKVHINKVTINTKCKLCSRVVANGIMCDCCDRWVHFGCAEVDSEEACNWKEDQMWFCKLCSLDASCDCNVSDERGSKYMNELIKNLQDNINDIRDMIQGTYLVMREDVEEAKVIVRDMRCETLTNNSLLKQQMENIKDSYEKEDNIRTTMMKSGWDIIQARVEDRLDLIESELLLATVSNGNGETKRGNTAQGSSLELSNNKSKIENSSCIQIIKANLFDDEESSLAHCVGEDILMSSGIAKTFLSTFGRREELLEQKKKVGDVAILEEDGRYMFQLITKRRTKKDKPKLKDLCQCLLNLKKLCNEKNISSVAMPKIGCGRDQLKWSQVRRSIDNIFSGSGVNIKIHIWNARIEANLGQHGDNGTDTIGIDKQPQIIDHNKRRVIVMGDSMLYNVEKISKQIGKEWKVNCFPGVRTDQLTKIVKNSQAQEVEEVEMQPPIIIVHVGTNSVKGWKRNGNAINDNWELVTELKGKFPGADIAITGVSHRLDVSDNEIDNVNDDIEWVATQLGCTYTDPNIWLLKDSLGKDGLHYNYKGHNIMTNIILGIVNNLKN